METYDESSNCAMLDLYDDLITDEGVQRQENYQELETKYQEALDKIMGLEKQLEESSIKETELTKKTETLEKNITDLLVTARAELQRKDRELAELRKKSEPSLFRRWQHRPNVRQRRESQSDTGDNESEITETTYKSEFQERSNSPFTHSQNYRQGENTSRFSRKRKYSTEMDRYSDSKKSRLSADSKEIYESDSKTKGEEGCKQDFRHRNDKDRRSFRACSIVPHSNKQEAARKLLEKSKRGLIRRRSDIDKNSDISKILDTSKSSNSAMEKGSEKSTKKISKQENFHSDKENDDNCSTLKDKPLENKSDVLEKLPDKSRLRKYARHSKERSCTPNERSSQLQSPSLDRLKERDRKSQTKDTKRALEKDTDRRSARGDFDKYKTRDSRSPYSDKYSQRVRKSRSPGRHYDRSPKTKSYNSPNNKDGRQSRKDSETRSPLNKSDRHTLQRNHSPRSKYHSPSRYEGRKDKHEKEYKNSDKIGEEREQSLSRKRNISEESDVKSKERKVKNSPDKKSSEKCVENTENKNSASSLRESETKGKIIVDKRLGSRMESKSPSQTSKDKTENGDRKHTRDFENSGKANNQQDRESHRRARSRTPKKKKLCSNSSDKKEPHKTEKYDKISSKDSKSLKRTESSDRKDTNNRYARERGSSGEEKRKSSHINESEHIGHKSPKSKNVKSVNSSPTKLDKNKPRKEENSLRSSKSREKSRTRSKNRSTSDECGHHLRKSSSDKVSPKQTHSTKEFRDHEGKVVKKDLINQVQQDETLKSSKYDKFKSDEIKITLQMKSASTEETREIVCDSRKAKSSIDLRKLSRVSGKVSNNDMDEWDASNYKDRNDDVKTWDKNSKDKKKRMEGKEDKSTDRKAKSTISSREKHPDSYKDKSKRHPKNDKAKKEFDFSTELSDSDNSISPKRKSRIASIVVTSSKEKLSDIKKTPSEQKHEKQTKKVKKKEKGIKETNKDSKKNKKKEKKKKPNSSEKDKLLDLQKDREALLKEIELLGESSFQDEELPNSESSEEDSSVDDKHDYLTECNENRKVNSRSSIIQSDSKLKHFSETDSCIDSDRNETNSKTDDFRNDTELHVENETKSNVDNAMNETKPVVDAGSNDRQSNMNSDSKEIRSNMDSDSNTQKSIVASNSNESGSNMDHNKIDINVCLKINETVDIDMNKQNLKLDHKAEFNLGMHRNEVESQVTKYQNQPEIDNLKHQSESDTEMISDETVKNSQNEKFVTSVNLETQKDISEHQSELNSDIVRNDAGSNSYEKGANSANLEAKKELEHTGGDLQSAQVFNKFQICPNLHHVCDESENNLQENNQSDNTIFKIKDGSDSVSVMQKKEHNHHEDTKDDNTGTICDKPIRGNEQDQNKIVGSSTISIMFTQDNERDLKKIDQNDVSDTTCIQNVKYDQNINKQDDGLDIICSNVIIDKDNKEQNDNEFVLEVDINTNIDSLHSCSSADMDEQSKILQTDSEMLNTGKSSDTKDKFALQTNANGSGEVMLSAGEGDESVEEGEITSDSAEEKNSDFDKMEKITLSSENKKSVNDLVKEKDHKMKREKLPEKIERRHESSDLRTKLHRINEKDKSTSKDRPRGDRHRHEKDHKHAHTDSREQHKMKKDNESSKNHKEDRIEKQTYKDEKLNDKVRDIPKDKDDNRRGVPKDRDINRRDISKGKDENRKDRAKLDYRKDKTSESSSSKSRKPGDRDYREKSNHRSSRERTSDLKTAHKAPTNDNDRRQKGSDKPIREKSESKLLQTIDKDKEIYKSKHKKKSESKERDGVSKNRKRNVTGDSHKKKNQEVIASVSDDFDKVDGMISLKAELTHTDSNISVKQTGKTQGNSQDCYLTEREDNQNDVKDPENAKQGRKSRDRKISGNFDAISENVDSSDRLRNTCPASQSITDKMDSDLDFTNDLAKDYEILNTKEDMPPRHDFKDIAIECTLSDSEISKSIESKIRKRKLSKSEKLEDTCDQNFDTEKEKYKVGKDYSNRQDLKVDKKVDQHVKQEEEIVYAKEIDHEFKEKLESEFDTNLKLNENYEENESPIRSYGSTHIICHKDKSYSEESDVEIDIMHVDSEEEVAPVIEIESCARVRGFQRFVKLYKCEKNIVIDEEERAKARSHLCESEHNVQISVSKLFDTHQMPEAISKDGKLLSDNENYKGNFCDNTVILLEHGKTSCSRNEDLETPHSESTGSENQNKPFCVEKQTLGECIIKSIKYPQGLKMGYKIPKKKPTDAKEMGNTNEDKLGENIERDPCESESKSGRKRHKSESKSERRRHKSEGSNTWSLHRTEDNVNYSDGNSAKTHSEIQRESSRTDLYKNVNSEKNDKLQSSRHRHRSQSSNIREQDEDL